MPFPGRLWKIGLIFSLALDSFDLESAIVENMSDRTPKFIFVFLDGLGLGKSTLDNPLAAAENTIFLMQLLGGPLLQGLEVRDGDLLFKAIDAQLGVPGLPQSATGQTALYTGRNAPAFLGRHLTGFANGSLRILIEESGLFKQAIALGKTATHANLYSPAYFEAIEQRRLRYSVGTLLNLTANLPFRMQADYERGEAIYWDITGELAHHRDISTPPITPEAAGEVLVRLGSQYHVTLFECYLTDYAGHAQDHAQAKQVLQRVDQFLESVICSLPRDTTLIVSSDHGNIEDLSTKLHTLNPVPLMVVGPHAPAFQAVNDITEITPMILRLLAGGRAIADPSLN